MIKRKLFALCMIAILLVGCAPKEASYEQIDAKEAQAMMTENDNEIVLDVRTEEEYNEAHITGAINIPNESLSDAPPSELKDKEQLIMVYCRSGNRSKQAAKKLSAMGYTNIVEFGGINDWQGTTESAS